MNVIPDRVYRFLKEYPPFSMLDKLTLEKLAGETIIKYLQAGEFVFTEGEAPQEYIYVVREGAVELLKEEEGLLVEVCDEGDLFGLRPLLANQPYALSAKAAEECLLYAIKVDNLQELIETQPKVGYYLAQNFAFSISDKYIKRYKGKIFLDKDPAVLLQTSLFEIQSVNHSKSPVCCAPSATIQEAARIMQQKQVGSILITNDEQHPIGIVTDRDLRNRVVTGEVSRRSAITEIMTQPVVTILPDCSVAEVQMAMMKNGIHHLCLTQDGSPYSPVVGILSEHDLLVLQGNNPAILIREMKRSTSAIELAAIRTKAEGLLRQYLEREVAMDFISTVMTEINDALITRVIEIAMKELSTPLPDLKWCWMGLGSEGRGEQLLRTDQDSALVFEDVPEEALEENRVQFLAFAKRVTYHLNTCGFAYCPGNMMASNPKWCLSLQEWKNQFSEWILMPTNQNIMHCNIFFDFRPLYGERALPKILSEHIFEKIPQKGIFLSVMGKNALQNPPPLTFFRNFVVEKNGEHKDAFNIKSRAMMPLTDAARLLILGHQVAGINNTIKRFEKLAELEPNYKELFEQAADAYEILIRYRALQGLKNNNSGKFLLIEEMSKMQKLNLRNTFRPIGELHDIIIIRYQVNYFN
ncbi:DUF294 nucleotidyltransferase-like domain-containing protein [Lewinella sp. LCG006]|uniref:DUF294 nucleotidyltransferase-like domain-containing protein n=1 Tax=Lewinella sp. LCG006 TaxID=3231911 RepID=UPI0034603E6A